MPATEQTWRDSKWLHRIFAVTSVLMLMATIWMFGADHDREWKGYQRTARDVDLRLTAWRKQQAQSDEVKNEQARLEVREREVKSQAVDPALFAEFLEAAKDLAEGKVITHIEKLGEELSVAAETAREKREAWAEDRTDAKQSEKISAEEAAGTKRARLIEELNELVRKARFREDLKSGEKKFRSANLDAAKADVDLAIRDNLDPTERQAKVDRLKAEVDALTIETQQANALRQKLAGLLAKMQADETAVAKAIAENLAEEKRVEKAEEQRRSNYFEHVWGPVYAPGKKWLELPILSAFNSPLKIDNLWSDGLTQDYNFKRVPRYDRCTTCHQQIAKTLPGTSDQPAFESARMLEFVLAKPTTPVPDDEKLRDEDLVQRVYGLTLASEGLVSRNDVTISGVQAKSLGAMAEAVLPEECHAPQNGLQWRKDFLKPSALRPSAISAGLLVGDVIAEIDGDAMIDGKRAVVRLAEEIRSGKAVKLTIRRGLPNPYASHPRLDLYVSALSPHKLSTFACTVCHDGQGSATDFKWASHTPDSLLQQERWGKDHGWFDNPHWIYPMFAKRFAEAACLKCHHEVTELQASDRFPDAPAPKVTHGFEVVRGYGCFGCHEINGFDGARRIGPDLRLEPNFFAAAQQLKNDPGFDKLSDQAKAWAEELITNPERDASRRSLYEALLRDRSSQEPVLNATTQEKIVPLFKDVERAGKLRKVGPSLRFVNSKLDSAFAYDWIREPKAFRPDTRMPQFFGLWKHLDSGKQDYVEIVERQRKLLAEKRERLAQKGDVDFLNRQLAEHTEISYEPMELLGMVAYLQDRSQKFEYLDPPSGMSEPAADRGKVFFEERGCLACHTHKSFPGAKEYERPGFVSQGPDLSSIGDKFNAERNPNGRKWLYSWIRQPSRYHVRTKMPDLKLDPVAIEKDKDGKPTRWTDPVADIVEYLLADSKAGWTPRIDPAAKMDEAGEQALDDLVLDHLRDAASESAAQDFSVRGIPESRRGEFKGGEVELVVSDESYNAKKALTKEQKLLYVGRKTIAKHGCYACHDIPGFEDAKPIGTTLADWGRKDPSRLAFEHITHYVGHHGGGEHGHAEKSHDDHSDQLDPLYEHELKAGHRSGFLYQKLLEPRSYDFEKTQNKPYKDRLRMPAFPFNHEDREAVVTFLLGLVADPPSEKYLYRPNPRQQAILAGQQVIEKYNCGGCHILAAEKWQIAYQPGDLKAQNTTAPFSFVHQPLTTEAAATATKVDSRNQLRVTFEGVPKLDKKGFALAVDSADEDLEAENDYDPSTLKYSFSLWKPAVIGVKDDDKVVGHVYQVGGKPVSVDAKLIQKRFPTRGGLLSKYLVPQVTAREQTVNPNANGDEAWAWGPPPLVGQGRKVQTDWMYEFLLDPHPIRPAVVLRMPKFNLSPDEATKLANYFAAVDNVEYPYELDTNRRQTHLETADALYRKKLEGESKSGKRLEDAVSIVTDGTFCVKCHLVGDFEPVGSDKAKAPNLAQVYNRLRPDYMRQWIATPSSILPYTTMPVNIDPANENLFKLMDKLYPGSKEEKLDAVVDLLSNFDEYAKQRSRIAPLVKPATTPMPQPAAGAQ